MGKNILVFFLLLLFFSCTKSDIPIKTNHNKITKKYLALGDSYTIGEGVLEKERWPVILTEKLNQEEILFDTPRIIATTGWTTGDLINAIENEDLKTYDLVSLLIGVNNQFQGLDFDIYKREFRELLEKAIKLTANNPDKVFVVSIPDYGVTPFGKARDPQKISAEIKAYNDFKKKVTAEYGVTYINITPVSRKAEKDESLLAADEVHPSGKMYHEWVDLIFPEIRSKFLSKSNKK